MKLYSIHNDIYVSKDLSKYQYVKFNTRLVGETATVYDLTDEDLADRLQEGYHPIKIGGKMVLYKKLYFVYKID